ncbi:MAG TPA: hypothetical protein VF472_11055 [Burkholderiaceae bacterium]
MKKILLLACMLLASAPGWAQIVTAKGVGTITYQAAVGPNEKAQAYTKAQVAAVERYYAENGQSEAENFESIEDKVAANLDKFVMTTTVLNEQDDPNFHKYTLTVKVELNLAKLRNTLKNNSAAGLAAPVAKSQMVYVFVGREVASVKKFDDRVVEHRGVSAEASMQGSEQTKGSEGESVKKGKVSTSSSMQANANLSASMSVNTETGGSRTSKSDETGYRMLSMTDQKTSVTSVFSQSGFVVADPDFVLADGDMKSVINDYSHGDDLAPATLRSMVASLRKAQVPYLVLATFNVGPAAADPATGLQRVTVSVTGRVLDLSGSLPREVASVPPVQYSGLGATNDVAQGKALKDASLAAAREVVSRLNVAGIH